MPLEIRHLDHIYSAGSPFEFKALKDINLTVEDGEFIGLIGHTGSGKSTLIQHLNG
ncbi:MAG: ATP-binding cassette domain-containing protein, partial [Eubacterium sp.]